MCKFHSKGFARAKQTCKFHSKGFTRAKQMCKFHSKGFTLSRRSETLYRTKIFREADFIHVNPFNKNSLKLDRERNMDISVQRGYCDIDTIIVNFPSYAIPKPVSLKSNFGELSFNMKHEKGKLEIVQTFLNYLA
jgi:hypothetical protein